MSGVWLVAGLGHSSLAARDRFYKAEIFSRFQQQAKLQGKISGVDYGETTRLWSKCLT